MILNCMNSFKTDLCNKENFVRLMSCINGKLTMPYSIKVALKQSEQSL